MTMELEQTLTAASKGDHDAWRRLIDAYSGRVYGLIFSRCRNSELAEEITQATFAKVVSKLGDYQEQGRFESWLFRIAMNQFRDELRRSKRQARAAALAAKGEDPRFGDGSMAVQEEKEVLSEA